MGRPTGYWRQQRLRARTAPPGGSAGTRLIALLDTDILIDLLRQHTPTVDWLGALPEPPDVPGFAAMELYQGCQNKRQADGVSRLLRPFLIVWASPLDCNAAMLHFATLKLSHGIGLLDCLIAACAVERSTVLYSFNVRHFASYPGLTVERPYIKP